jgi:hypothetical protein
MTAGTLLVSIVLALEVVGCNDAIRPVEWPELHAEGRTGVYRIVPKDNRNVAELTADDVVRVMRQVGFSDEQILDLGPDLRDALLSAGAAVVFDGDRAEMILRVNREYLLVRSRAHGSMIYDIARSRFGLLPPAP